MSNKCLYGSLVEKKKNPGREIRLQSPRIIDPFEFEKNTFEVKYFPLKSLETFQGPFYPFASFLPLLFLSFKSKLENKLTLKR